MMAILISLIISNASAQTAAPAESIGTSSVVTAEKFRKSRLTRDEAEGLADRRKLRIGKGEDRTVDIDFDPELSPERGLSIGN